MRHQGLLSERVPCVGWETLKTVEWRKLKSFPGQTLFLHAFVAALVSPPPADRAGGGKRKQAKQDLAAIFAPLNSHMELTDVRSGLERFAVKRLKSSPDVAAEISDALS
eukprot:SAG25_NODE_750_length_5576_cov_2.191163_2_plen_109_part_00